MHILSEQEISWEDFIEILTSNEFDGFKIDDMDYQGHWMKGHTYPDFELREFALRFYHGASIYAFAKDMNQSIKYGFGYFYLDKIGADYIETGEFDEFEEVEYGEESETVVQSRLSLLQRMKLNA